MPKRTALLPFDLQTERLLLRQWRPEDVAALAEIYAQPEVEVHLGARSVDETREQVERFARQWRGEGFSHWAAEDLDTGKLVGRIGLMRHHDWPESQSPVEVGWTLDRDWWGRGLATEGARAAVACWRNFLSEPELISITRPTNLRSRAVMERLGLTFRGTTFWHDHVQVWYSLDRG